VGRVNNFFGTALDSFLRFHPPENMSCRKLQLPAELPLRLDAGSPPRKFYRPRDHETSPFFKIVRDRFDDFERVYPERYQQRYGYWRPVIRSSIDKFLRCGD